MSWDPTKRRAALTLTTTALVVATLLGSSLGTTAKEMAAQKKTSHSRSDVVSYIPGQPLVVTIEHPYYDASATVLYAEITDPSGAFLGYLLPITSPSGVTPKKIGQIVKSNRITVAFNTIVWYTLPPKDLTALPPSIAAPSVGSGSIIIITTNVATDVPPVESIQLDSTALAL